MKARGSPRSRWLLLLAPAVFALVAVAVAQTPVPSTPASIKVFGDDFSGRTTYVTYKAVGQATISQGGCLLTVSNPTGDPKSGVSVSLPPGGIGVRCMGFGGFQIPEAPI